MNHNLQPTNTFYSFNNSNDQSNFVENQLSKLSVFSQSPKILNNCTLSNSQISLENTKNLQSLFLSQKLIKDNFYFNSINVPKQFNDQLVKKLINDQRFSLNKMNPNNNIQSLNQSKRTRIPFTKDEDEKIKQLVGRFGSGHWELISHFMERRTAKQCRDRYTNYLVPGVFQGEWMKEEDELLTQLYNKIGPRWSALQRYIPYRSATNIKNRWHYFLAKQNPSKENAENESEMKNEGLNDSINQKENIFIEKEEIKDQTQKIKTEEKIDKDYLFRPGNESYENKINIFDFDNEWDFNYYPSEPKPLIDN